jgi:cation-transporting ATPase 13A3/4/5
MLLPLFLFWSKSLRIKLLYVKVPNIHSKPTHVLVEGTAANIEIIKLRRAPPPLIGSAQNFELLPKLSSFMYRFIKFEYDFSSDTFRPVVFKATMSQKDILTRYSCGIDKTKHQSLIERYGPCQLEVPRKSFIRLLIDEVLNPFYLFQVFSVLLWFYEGYTNYAYCIIIISVGSVVENLHEIISNINSLRKMAHYQCPVEVIRNTNGNNETKETISSDGLVPGDVIHVPENTQMPCDVVLLNGTAIVNEAMLTGESVPVIKNAITPISNLYNPQDYDSSKKYTLYNGTKVIQTKGPENSQVRGLVVRTGYLTSKGSLVRDILYPKEVNFPFYRDSYIFVGFMALVGIVGFMIVVPILIRMGTETTVLITKCLDLITITVPPALPAAMSVGVAFAVVRLKKTKIFCTSPNRVNVSGRIQMMVFDKTGTLTEDGLQMMGVRASKGSISDPHGTSCHFEEFAASIKSIIPRFSKDSEFLSSKVVILNEAMASCHAITRVEYELLGDPLEIRMFESTGWMLDENISEEERHQHILAKVKTTTLSKETYEVAIIKRFDFEAALQRMSVLVKNQLDSSIRAYVKGSPEKIMELCHPSSIPAGFHSILEDYTRMGYRVIALSFKMIPTSNTLELTAMAREKVEKDLTFLGLLVMENKLKDATKGTIKTLNECHIRTIMATGDNNLTAISVARECNILNGNQDVYFADLHKNQI